MTAILSLLTTLLMLQVNYPGFVNKYANRSNGGIPIFAQERIKERAAKRSVTTFEKLFCISTTCVFVCDLFSSARHASNAFPLRLISQVVVTSMCVISIRALCSLAELKLVEEDRKQQEDQLRRQLLMAGIQDGPGIHYEMQVTVIATTSEIFYCLACSGQMFQRRYKQFANRYLLPSASGVPQRDQVVQLLPASAVLVCRQRRCRSSQTSGKAMFLVYEILNEKASSCSAVPKFALRTQIIAWETHLQDAIVFRRVFKFLKIHTGRFCFCLYLLRFFRPVTWKELMDTRRFVESATKSAINHASRCLYPLTVATTFAPDFTLLGAYPCHPVSNCRFVETSVVLCVRIIS